MLVSAAGHPPDAEDQLQQEEAEVGVRLLVLLLVLLLLMVLLVLLVPLVLQGLLVLLLVPLVLLPVVWSPRQPCVRASVSDNLPCK